MAVKRNILAGWAAHLVTVLIGFFLMPFILGMMGDSRYGAWLLVNAIAGYSGLIYAGFGATICRYVADSSARKEWERLNQFVSSIQAVYYGTASLVLLATGICVAAAPYMGTWDGVPLWEVRAAMAILGCTIALGMVASVFGGVLVGTQQLHVKRAIEVTCGVLRGGLTVLLLRGDWGLVTLSGIFLSVTVLEHGLSAWFAYRHLPSLSVSPRHVSRAVLNECFSFSAFNAIALFAEYLIYFTDTIVIGFVLGPAAIVPYQIGLRIAQMIQMPITQVGEAILPRAGELAAGMDRSELGRLVTKAMGLATLLAGGFLVGGAYFGDFLVTTWIGKSYTDTHTVMCLLLATQLVAMPMVIVRKALLGSGEVRVPAFIDLLEAVLNLVLSLILIHFLGIVGVAIGTLVPLLVVETFVLLPFAMRRLHMRRKDLQRQVIHNVLPCLVALTVYCEVVHKFVPLQGWATLIAVTAGGGAVLLSVRALIHWFGRTAPPISVPHEQSIVS
ncbi:MAG: polysaccharide biosynthesis C-terminal domain-containing protein [Planctomycetaceae bacterium]|nr:polysaccharide biosynthesis C-terminal domain-containing protein [Planctomycetaceae bacterium]